MSHPDTSSPVVPSASGVKRISLVTIGVVAVGLAALGVAVPGLPTTIFLIVAVWCFARSVPALERVLIRNRLFAPFLGFVDRRRRIPASTKAVAIGVMWGSVAVAVALGLAAESTPAWVPGLVAIAAVVGTVAILRWDAGVVERPIPARVNAEPAA